MWVVGYETKCTPEQWDRHQQTCLALMEMEKASYEAGDPIVFHGTGLISASWIIHSGFKSAFAGSPPEGRVAPSGFQNEGVHWGTLAAARSFAERRTDYDNPAVFLWMRLSELEAQRQVMPDWFAITEIASPMNRQHSHIQLESFDDDNLPLEIDGMWSLRHAGAIVSVGDGMLDKLRLINPLTNVAVGPNWKDARQRRMHGEGSGAVWSLPPAPGIREATDVSHPPTFTPEQMSSRIAKAWGRAGAPSEDAELSPKP